MNIPAAEKNEKSPATIDTGLPEPGRTRAKYGLALIISCCLTAAVVGGAFAYLKIFAPDTPRSATTPAHASKEAADRSGFGNNSSASPPSSSRTVIEHSPDQAAVTAHPSDPRAKKVLKDDVRALYITSWTAGTKRFNELIDDVAHSTLNAVVIDIKDSTGKVGYSSALPEVARYGTYERRMGDIRARLAYCKEKKVYTIARIAVFEDPALARSRPALAVQRPDGGEWRDRKGLAWVDPASHEVWEYNVAIAKEAAALGFDEVQFDYVRFPTDGKLQAIRYPRYDRSIPKHEVIRNFFRYVDSELRPLNIVVSADLFGLTLEVDDDMNIGQQLEDVADYVDFICPMVYPSHYPSGHMKYKQPGLHPYEVVRNGLIHGRDRLAGKRAKLRPWLQDFKLGGSYDKSMILAQIRAAHELGITGYSMWNARNIYTKTAYSR